MAKAKNALKILDDIIGDDADLREKVVEARLNAQIAQLIYQARTEAGLTQRELAERIGTKQPVIARLEDADYSGHSLSMLERVARALGKMLRVSLAAGTVEDSKLSIKVAPKSLRQKFETRSIHARNYSEGGQFKSQSASRRLGARKNKSGRSSKIIVKRKKA